MQNSEDRDRLSRWRQDLSQLTEELQRLLPVFLDRRPLVKGSVYELRRKCGKPSCACARGAPHVSPVLSRSEAGRTRLRSIPPERLAALRELTARYRSVRRARARWVKIAAEMLAAIDRLEQARRQEP